MSATSPSAPLTVEGKVAVVTGAPRSIGRAIASELTDRGAAVAVHYHSRKAEADATIGELCARGVTAIPFSADLKEVVRAVSRRFGALKPPKVKRGVCAAATGCSLGGRLRLSFSAVRPRMDEVPAAREVAIQRSDPTLAVRDLVQRRFGAVVAQDLASGLMIGMSACGVGARWLGVLATGLRSTIGEGLPSPYSRTRRAPSVSCQPNSAAARRRTE